MNDEYHRRLCWATTWQAAKIFALIYAIRAVLIYRSLQRHPAVTRIRYGFARARRR